jgi:hypothetical protein
MGWTDLQALYVQADHAPPPRRNMARRVNPTTGSVLRFMKAATAGTEAAIDGL